MRVDSPVRARRRQRSRDPLSRRRTIYEWSSILLLMLPATVGIILFGAVRNWSAGFLMVLTFLGIALFLIRPLLNRDISELRIPPGGILFGGFLVYALALIPFSSVPYETKVECLKLASYMGAYWAWTESAARQGRWRVLLFIPLFIAVLVALYALIQHIQGSTMVLHLERHEQYGMRASGTFRAPAHLGAYMGTMITLSVALVLLPSAGAMLRMFGGYGLLLFFPALFLSQSRSGWVGTLMGVPVVLLLIMWKRSRRAFWVTAVLIPVVTGAILAALWFASPMFQERADAAIRIEGTASWRLVAWKDTWEMIQVRPVTGFGPGTYRWMYPPYQSWPGERWLRYAHNEYVHLAAEYGFVGVALLGLFFAVVFVQALRLYFRAKNPREWTLIAAWIGCMVAALGHALFDFNFHVFSLVHLLVLISGVTVGTCYRADLLRTRAPPLGAWLTVGGGLSISAIVAAVWSLQIALSSTYMIWLEEEKAQVDLFEPNPYAGMERRIQQAMRVDSGFWLPYLEHGDLIRRRASLIRDREYRHEQAQVALEQYRRAYALNPYDMNVIYGIGRAYHLLDERERSLDYLRRAHAHWPAKQFYSKQLGRQLIEAGHYEEALEVFREAHRRGGWSDPMIRTSIRRLETQLGP